MQKCAFCEFDYGEITLQEGRCPQCGSIIAWPDEPDSSQPGDTTATVVFPIKQPNAVDANATVIFGEEVTQPAAPMGPSAAIAASAVPRSEGLEDLDKLWRDSISSTSDLRFTIKGVESQHTVSDSLFSVLPREVRSPLNITDAPVDYELLDIIGQGGVGVVYTARQASIDRTVAIKMLREEYRTRNEHKEKFLAEAILTGELDHPNIVPIYDLGRNKDGELFYSMKNVIGTPWDRAIEQKSIRENIEILLKVADAVAFAHSRSVVHRDLKPENVMLGNFGEVLVMDWGIAVATEGFRRTASILRSQAMGGTPAYMAPELATGPVDAIGQPADVYLLGAILFEILTGTPPHFGNNVMECVRNASQNIIRETTVTGELMEIAIRAMATVPRRRFRSVQAFQAAIRLYQAHSESIMLSDNAETELSKAISTKDYSAFSRAVFAFDEALSLWNENEAATLGLMRAKTAYAKTAFDKGDYDLGLSLLNPEDSEHQELVKKLRAAIADREARQNRFRTIRKLAVSLAGFIIIAGSIALIVILQLYSRASHLNAELDLSQEDLRSELKKTEKALKAEEIQRELAIRSGEIADKRRTEAEVARRNAELARLDSIAQKQRAEESSYFAEIGLVGASIQQNQFAIAADILNQQEKSPAKSKIRHWEWGRHRYLVRGGSNDDPLQNVKTFSTDESVECIDCSSDDAWIAVGIASGEVDLWKRGEKQSSIRFRHGRSLSHLDFDTTGTFIATSGVDDDNTGSVCVWRLQGDQAPRLEKKLKMKGSGATTVAFSNDAQARYVAAGDTKRIGRIWNWREDREMSPLLGHIEAITSIAFSPNNQLVASSSRDGTVRLWKTENGMEVQRFSGHQAPSFAVAFSPDGKSIASGGADRRILVWEVDPREDNAGRIDDVRRQVQGETLQPQRFRTFLGHTGTIQDLSFSRDGRKLVSSGNDNLVCVWNVETLSSDEASPPMIKLRGHGGWVRACRFTADETEIVSGGDDRSWKSWMFSKYREKQIFSDGTDPILDARFSPTDPIIATAHADGTVGLWNPTLGERIAVLSDGHEYLTNKARMTPNGKIIATDAGDNTLRIWEVQRGTQMAMMEHAGRNGVFSLSQDGQWLVAGGDEFGVGIWSLDVLGTPTRIRGWPAKKAENAIRPTISEATSVSISDDGKHVVVGDKSGSVEFWEVEQPRLVNKVFGHSEAVVACFFLAPETIQDPSEAVMTVSSDGTAGWWDFKTGKELPRERLRHLSSVQLASMSPSGRYLVSSTSIDQRKAQLWLWDLMTGEKVGTKELSGDLVQDIVFSSTSTPSVYVTTSGIDDSRKRIWQWNGMQESWKEVGKSGMLSESLWGAIPTDGDSNLVTYGGRGARLWRLQDGVELKSFRPSASIGAIAFAANGRLLASASDDGTAMIWDVQKRSSTQKLVGSHSGAIRDLAFSKDDTKLITSGADGRIVVWDVTLGNPIQSGRISETAVVGNSIRFSLDGETILVGCDDDSIRLYDANTLAQTRKLLGHNAAVTCASFSLDGRWVVSGSQDKTIRIWSVSTGKEIARLLGHSAPLTSVSFSSDGLRVLSSSQDTTARLWDVDRIAQSAENSSDTATEESGADLGEVLLLEFHSRETTVAGFSPDGRSILTASVDGKAVLWPSERVPLSLRMSNPNITYQPSDGPKRIDPLAVLCQPGSLDLDGAKLDVKFAKDEGNSKRLLVDQSDGMFEIQGSQLHYHPTKDTRIEMGSYEEWVGVGMQITFSKSATHAGAQQVVRHIAYQSESQTQADLDVKSKVIIQVMNQHGLSGNAVPESIIISHLESDR